MKNGSLKKLYDQFGAEVYTYFLLETLVRWNDSNNIKRHDSDSLSFMIGSSFIWHETEKGHDYWKRIDRDAK